MPQMRLPCNHYGAAFRDADLDERQRAATCRFCGALTTLPGEALPEPAAPSDAASPPGAPSRPKVPHPDSIKRTETVEGICLAHSAGQSGRTPATAALSVDLSAAPGHRMQIREFRESDEPSVVALWSGVFGYSTPHNEPRLVIRQKLALQRELFLVAVVQGGVVGTVMGGYDGHRGWIYSLAVNPAHRRRGVGAALVRSIEAALIELGCPKINLQVLATNAEVVGFYQKLGYAVEERISMGKVVAHAAPSFPRA